MILNVTLMIQKYPTTGFQENCKNSKFEVLK